MNPNDTIAACATPPGHSSIAVIRLSGEKSVPLLHRIFEPRDSIQEFKAQHVYYGHIRNPESGDDIDTVLVTAFYKPDSYTGEDVVEISCHGNPLIVDQILRLLINLGLRIAGPGEFTKRALLNGKIDLIQAEAVLDTINAPCEQAKRLAMLQYEGKLSEQIYEIRSRIVDLLFLVEAEIDFPEEEDVRRDRTKFLSDLQAIVSSIDGVLRNAAVGVMIKEGYKVLILGRANVGKSTLFNRLLGYDRAIVHEQPGTTRDFLEESVQMGGIYVRLFDTAGILSQAKGPDAIAQQRTRSLVDEADLVLLMFDGADSINEEDVYLYDTVKHRTRLLLVNKIDLNMRMSNEQILTDSIKISAKNGDNIALLTETIRNTLLPHHQDKYPRITRHRHIDALSRARTCLVDAKNAPSVDTTAYELHSALNEIAELTGQVLRTEILDRIFAEFCVGK